MNKKKKKVKKAEKVSDEEQRKSCLESIVKCKVELSKELCKRDEGDAEKIKTLKEQINENKMMIRKIEEVKSNKRSKKK